MLVYVTFLLHAALYNDYDPPACTHGWISQLDGGGSGGRPPASRRSRAVAPVRQGRRGGGAARWPTGPQWGGGALAPAQGRSLTAKAAGARAGPGPWHRRGGRGVEAPHGCGERRRAAVRRTGAGPGRSLTAGAAGGRPSRPPPPFRILLSTNNTTATKR